MLGAKAMQELAQRRRADVSEHLRVVVRRVEVHLHHRR
jgi:hypothetical protein